MDDGSEPCIRHQPFYKPVIDFTLEEDGSLWVLLDADWSSQGTIGEGEASNCVEVRRWTSDNVPILSRLTYQVLTVISEQFGATDPSPLALSLNSCTLPGKVFLSFLFTNESDQNPSY